MIFNLPKPTPPKPITSITSLASALESGKFQALTINNLYQDELLKPVKYKGKAALFDRFLAIAEKNPPRKVPFGSALELVGNSPKHVVIISSEEIFLAKKVQGFCKLDYTIDPEFQFGSFTVYFRPDWHLSKTFDQVHLRLISKELDKIKKKYEPELYCEDENEEEPTFTISFVEMQGAVWSILIANGLCISTFLMELLVSFIKKKSDGNNVIPEFHQEDENL